MSIRNKMMLVFSFVSALILLAASLTGYIFAKDRFTENIENQMRSTISAHVNKLDGWLVAKQKLVEVTAGTIQTAGGQGEIPASLLMGYKNVDKEFSDIYLGTTDGKVVSGKGWVPPTDFDSRTRLWYTEAMKGQKTIFTAPYVDADTQEMTVSIALPCKSVTGGTKGVVSADILLKTLVDNVKEITLEGQGYAFLTDSKGFVIAHPDASVVGKNIFEVEKVKDVSKVIKEIAGKDQGYKEYQENGKEMIMVYKQIPSTQWNLCISVEKAIVYQPLTNLKWLFIMITFVSILLVIAVTFFVARRITKPLNLLGRQLEQLAKGDLTAEARIAGKDELARLAGDFNKMVGDLRAIMHDIAASTLELQGHSVKLVDSAATVAANSQEMSATVGMVSTAVEQISAGTEENASSTEQVSHNVHAVAKVASEMSEASKEAVGASEQVASEVKEVSLVIEDISKSISQVADFAQEVASACKRSIAITQEAKECSSETFDIIQKLNVSSKQINKIVTVIGSIAEQTNMLALNATIEAAGAGEAGKGFAVVAGEVKELSKRTALEAGRIAQQIEDMQTEMNTAVTMVEKITHVIAETTDITHTIASAVSEQNNMSVSDAESSETGRLTTISKEVTIIAGKAQRVSQNALEAAKGVDALFHTNDEIFQKAAEVARSTEEMASMMNNINQATLEIAKGTQNISESVQETDKAISDTASKATTVSECAGEVGDLADRLKTLIGKFKFN